MENMDIDINGDPDDPLNFPINPCLSQRANRDAHRMYAKKLIEKIEMENTNSEGILHYKDEGEYAFCMEGKLKHNYDRLDAENWDLKEQLKVEKSRHIDT